MISHARKEKVINYVLERRCKEQGGFCFYRLEEPNGADTYYSVWILHALGQPLSDERTVDYLKNLQHPNGTYDSIFSAFYSIKGLHLLNRTPLRDPSKFILDRITEYHIHADDIPAEMTSIFKPLLFLIDIYKFVDLNKPGVDRNIQELVLGFQNADGGFGYKGSSLDETAKALQILELTKTDIDKSRISAFLRKCEQSDNGFTDVPGTSLSYIEHIHAGLTASSLLSYEPAFLKACGIFISGCQRKNGGYSRAIGDGIATIENTFHAVDSLFLISKLLTAI